MSPLPVGAIMGHEFAGEVVALGRGCTRWSARGSGPALRSDKRRVKVMLEPR